jgi:hypothetical protein
MGRGEIMTRDDMLQAAEETWLKSVITNESGGYYWPEEWNDWSWFWLVLAEAVYG